MLKVAYLFYWIIFFFQINPLAQLWIYPILYKLKFPTFVEFRALCSPPLRIAISIFSLLFSIRRWKEFTNILRNAV